MRDFIRVQDIVIVDGHLQGLRWLGKKPGIVAYDLCTSTDYSVLDMTKAFVKAWGEKLVY